MLAALLVLALLVALPSSAAADDRGTFTNPIAERGADPWLTYYKGNYYLMASTFGENRLTMRKSRTLAGLRTAPFAEIYKSTDPSHCCLVWAPEFHLLDGPHGKRWYVYFTAGDGEIDNQRSHVLESEGTDPMGPYHYMGRLFDPAQDTFQLDGSVLRLNGKLYFIASQVDGVLPQSLSIYPMTNPWTVAPPRKVISQPEHDWENVGSDILGFGVNEAPVQLRHGRRNFIVYSASYCATDSYALGLLTYRGGDPTEASSWSKSPEPVFEGSPENGVWSPGHNGFFKSPDGSEDWIVYHGNPSPEPNCGPGRTARAQRFTWNRDGTPNFGTPVPLGVPLRAPSGEKGW